jgi:hypothetical protein
MLFCRALAAACGADAASEEGQQQQQGAGLRLHDQAQQGARKGEVQLTLFMCTDVAAAAKHVVCCRHAGCGCMIKPSKVLAKVRFN